MQMKTYSRYFAKICIIREHSFEPMVGIEPTTYSFAYTSISSRPGFIRGLDCIFPAPPSARYGALVSRSPAFRRDGLDQV